MSRKPTGGLRGRPKGNGRLGDQTRLTGRIPTELYPLLEVYPEGRSFSRGGSPQLPVCVREALANSLICPNKRKTIRTSKPANTAGNEIKRQPKNVPLSAGEDKSQAKKTPADRGTFCGCFKFSFPAVYADL